MMCSIDGCAKPKLARGWCAMHYQRWRMDGEPGPAAPMLERRGLEARFWKFAERAEGCWEWTGGRSRDGYGQLPVRGTTLRAHRLAYELLVGPIPEGMTIDHLCFNPGCVNPEHLEPVSTAENIRRYWATVTHCKHGHPFDEANTYIRTSGHRQCRACMAAAQRRYQERKRMK